MLSSPIERSYRADTTSSPGFVHSRPARRTGIRLLAHGFLVVMSLVAASAQIRLQWNDNSSDETGFKIERALAANMVFAQIGIVGANTATYADMTVVPSVTYKYRVAAFNGNGTSGFSNVLTATAPQITTTTSRFTTSNLPKNAVPTISAIANRTILEDTGTGVIGFTVSDVDTAAGSLVVSGTSSNVQLVPLNTLVFAGTGANRTLTINPAPNQYGTATIGVSVSDGTSAASAAFILTVTAVNDRPTIGVIANQTIAQGASTGAIPFTIGDVETAAGSLTLSASSANKTLVPAANIIFGGSGSSRTISVIPVASQSGSANITVTASDGALAASRTFALVVVAPNQAPTINDIADLTIAQETTTGPLAFTISDVESPAENLTLSATSSNAVVVPVQNIVFGGSGANRTVTVTPASNQSGVITIVVTVSDGTKSTSDPFVVTVTPSLPPPWLTAAVGNPALAGNATYGAGTFTIAGAGTDIAGYSDQFHYVFQSANGDCEIVARVASMGNTNAEAKAGIMIRESPIAGSRYAAVLLMPDGGVRSQRRSVTGGRTAGIRVKSFIATRWLKVRRVGDSFTTFYSSDGIKWMQIETQSVSMSAVVTIGLAVTSRNTAALCTANIDGVLATP